MDALYKTLRVTHIEEAIPGVKIFYFEDDEAKAIPYKAGQYLTLVTQENGTEIRRSYSITSSPAWHEPLAIGVKRIENGYFSRKLIDDTKAGDVLITTGAAGLFTLPDDMQPVKQLFFFAAGSGITPVYSLIKTALQAYPNVSVVLIYSNASVVKTIFYHELLQLKNQFPQQFHIEFLFSNSPYLLKAHLHADLLRTYIKQYAVASLEGMLFYTCGPQNYMRLCTYTLQQMGVPASHIKKENFNTTKAIIRTEPPDKQPHNVTLHYTGKEYRFTVQYPHTILQAAKQEGIDMPFSCEVGRCGNCVARCLKGHIWHSNNEVLTEQELADGLVLTCVGYPVGSDVELSIS